MKLGFLAPVLVLAILIICAVVFPLHETEPAQANGSHLILFFDGATIPAGWTCISDDVGEPFYNRFPRGADIYGGQGGSATNTHLAFNLVTVNGPYVVSSGGTLAVSDCVKIQHTHSIATSSMSNESNYPAYRSLKVIRCDAGIPAVIPAGGIAMFSHNPPAGWTRYAVQDGYFVLGHSAVTTGGRDVHKHTNLHITTGFASETDRVEPNVIPTTGTSHVHEINAAEIGVANNEPPYKTVIMGKANADTGVPTGMIGMFDGAPTAAWNVISGTGGGFYHRFLQGDSNYGLVGGYEFHTHPPIELGLNETGWGSGDLRFAVVNTSPFGIKLISMYMHNHFYGCQFTTASNMPPYIDVVIGAIAQAPPAVITDNATAVDEITATINGHVLDIGDTTITERGFDWDTDGSTPFTHSWTEVGAFGTGAFSHGIDSLERGILYHYRAKAVNERLPGEWGYGAVLRFLTRPAVPTGFTALAGDEQVSLSWTKGQGALRTLIRRSTVAFPVNPTDGDLVYLGTDNVTVNTGLINSTTYFYSAWAEVTRDVFQQYSNTRATVQATPDNAPDVVTDNVTALTGTSATLNALITNIDGLPVAERGFDWDINSGETYANSWTEAGSFGVSSYSHPLAGLTKGQVYYYRGKARHATAVWGYGQEMQFITKPDPPTNFTATAGGNQINLSWVKGAGAYATFICRSITAFPVRPDDGTFIYFGTGTSYSDNCTSCVRYYYSAWSVAAGGDVAELSDGKADVDCIIYAAPSVTTNDAANITTNSAQLRGSLTSTCLEPLVYISFEWGMSPAVYTHVTPRQAMTRTGDFNYAIIGLLAGQRHYYRAKVENHVTGYGAEKSFYTASLPSAGSGSSSVTTLPVQLPAISVQSATISATSLTPGDTLTVSATVANSGTVNGSMRVKLYVNGQEEDSKSITVESGKSTPVTFNINRNEPGEYSVYVGAVNAGRFRVESPAHADIILFASLTLIFLSCILGIVYIRKRQWA